MTNIRWTDDEKTALAREAAKVMLDGEARHSLRALHIAQERVLPEDRRRPNIHTSKDRNTEWYRTGLALETKRLAAARAREAAVAHRAPAPTPAAAPQTMHGNGSDGPATAAPAAVEAPPAPDEMEAPAPMAVPAVADFSQAIVSLREVIVDGLASIFLEAALRAMSALANSTDESSAGTAHPLLRAIRPPPTVRKPSVLVVGLKGNQRTEIQRDYGARFDLRFIGSDESKDQLRSMAEKVQTTVLMTDFISHSHQDIVKARSTNWMPSSGGMTGLRQTLATLVH